MTTPSAVPPREARLSILTQRAINQATYRCQFPWPADCFVQAGSNGLVLAKEGDYRTAFFEAFPRNPDTFLRGEGVNMAAAETAAWERYQRMTDGHAHDWDRRHREDGYAYCAQCGIGSTVFDPLTSCHTCGVPARAGQDLAGRWYCTPHHDALPDDQLPALAREGRAILRHLGQFPAP